MFINFLQQSLMHPSLLEYQLFLKLFYLDLDINKLFNFELGGILSGIFISMYANM